MRCQFNNLHLLNLVHFYTDLGLLVNEKLHCKRALGGINANVKYLFGPLLSQGVIVKMAIY